MYGDNNDDELENNSDNEEPTYYSGFTDDVDEDDRYMIYDEEHIYDDDDDNSIGFSPFPDYEDLKKEEENEIEMYIANILKYLDFTNNIYKTEQQCPITLEQMDEAYKTVCNHYISTDAIINWFKEGKNTCPLCRKKLF